MNEKTAEITVTQEISYKPGGQPIYKQQSWQKLQEARRWHTQEE